MLGVANAAADGGLSRSLNLAIALHGRKKNVFSRPAVLLAIATFVIGVLSIVLGTTATMDLLDEVTRARFVRRPPEQIIYGGIYCILASVALGTLAEMSLSLRRWTA